MAQEIVVVIKGDAAQFTRTVSQVDAALARASRSAQGFGHGTVSQVQAASAAIRTLEGGVANNVRAVERWITTIPGVGKALQALFPVIGFIASAGLFVRMIGEAQQFIEKMNEVPKAIQQGFGQLSGSSQLANDELQKTNDTIQNNIDKLTGHRENGLAIMLDEARIAGDKLAQSLEQDNERIAAIMKQNHISILGGIVTGQAPTGDTEDHINGINQRLADAGHSYNAALHAAGGDVNNSSVKAAADNLYKVRADAIKQVQQRLAQDQQADLISSPLSGSGQSTKANINAEQGELDTLRSQQDNANYQSDNAKLAAQQKKIQDANDFADKQKQLQRQATETLRQQQEQIVKLWQTQLTELQSVQALSLSQEADFWIDRAAFAKAGSQSYLTAVENANKAIAQQVRENGKAQSDFNVNSDKISTPDLAITDREYIQTQSSGSIDFLKSLDEGVNIQRQNATAYAEAALQIQIATGQMSGYDAAVAQAQLHTQEYTEQLNLLKDALAQVTGTDSDAQKRRSDLNNQISQLNGQRAVQVLNDNAGINSQTLSGSWQQTMNDFIRQATDTAAQVREIFTSAVEGINNSLSNALLAHATNGREYRRSIESAVGGSLRSTGSSILNAGFHQVEGGALKALGLGGGKKPTGAAGDPLHVVMDGASSAASAASGLLGRLFGRGGSSGASNPLSSLFSGGKAAGAGLDTSNDTSALPDIASIGLQGFFASGGDVVANRPAIIGERGPELFVPSSAGRIVPNNQLGGLGGTNVTHNHYVDARGATDPAAVSAAVDRRMKAWAPTLTQTSIKAGHEYNARRPSSMRK